MVRVGWRRGVVVGGGRRASAEGSAGKGGRGGREGGERGEGRSLEEGKE